MQPLDITRTGNTVARLHSLADGCKEVNMARLRAIAIVLDGALRTATGDAPGSTTQSIRDRVLRYNKQDPDGPADGPASGPTTVAFNIAQ